MLAVFWNVFLAIIPVFVVYLLMQSGNLKKWHQMRVLDRLSFFVLFIFWLFFFPNTAYLFTLVRHLVNYCFEFNRHRVCEPEMWKVPFFFTYALIGLPTFYYALKKMTSVLIEVFGRFLRFFPIVMIPATSIGVMLGLFERFNTWELLTDPLLIFRTGFGYLANGQGILNFTVFTVSLYVIYYGTDHLWKKR